MEVIGEDLVAIIPQQWTVEESAFFILEDTMTEVEDKKNSVVNVVRRLVLVLMFESFLAVYYINATVGGLQSKEHLLEGDLNPKEKGPRTAIVMRSLAPLQPPVLQKIHRFAHEIQSWGTGQYDFWVLVDETNNNRTEQLIGSFFAKHGNDVQLPQVFSVSEKGLLEKYPNLTSYINNEPEPNFHNEPGLCCGRPIMWQMFIPVMGWFQNETQYPLVWTFEEDTSVHGHLSLLELIRAWDQQLATDVDLVALELKKDYWGRPLHTNNMEKIVQEMQMASVRWKMYSDAVQRHSLSLADAIVAEVSNNVMQFGERLIYPIAWKHNCTIVDLETVSVNSSVFGLRQMTGEGKLTSNQGIEILLNTSATPATLLFHEELPNS